MINVTIWFLRQNVLPDGAPDEHSPPSVRPAIVNRPKENRAMMRTLLERKRGWVQGPYARATPCTSSLSMNRGRRALESSFSVALCGSL